MDSLGHQGVVPCPLCSNITKDGRWGTLPLTNLQCGRWEPHSDQSVRDIVNELKERKGTLKKGAFTALETRKGFHYHEMSITLDSDCKTVSTLQYDWPHVCFIGGIFSAELTAFMDLARQITPPNRKACVTFDDLHVYLQQWRRPSKLRSCANIFEKGRLSATASEQLTAAPVVRKYFEDVVIREPSMGPLHEAARSMALCCGAIELLQCASRQLITPAQLHDGIVHHLQKHQEVY